MSFNKIFSFATLTLLVALTLSAIAAWYSIQGLVAIFAAAVVPIMIMGGSLEIAKVVTTVWLHRYWNRASWKLKFYLIPAVIALAFLTSMGIFGFLSKSHSDQSLVSGDVQAKLAIYDEKINSSKENIEAARKALQQMDAAVDQVMGRSTDVQGAQQSVNIRRSQADARAKLQAEIDAEQTKITKLTEEVAPIRAEVRKVEAEVGPIKYIAALIYGDNPDTNLLERAVRWMIILIVFVFDPLALVLVLAAQSSYKWLDDDLRNRKKDEEEEAEEKFKETFFNTKLNDDTSKFLDEAFVDILNDTPYDNGEKDNANKDIQQNNSGSDVMDGKDELEASSSDADERIETVGHSEEEPKRNLGRESGNTQSEQTVKTEEVTSLVTDGDYVQYQGKSIQKAALMEMHPELFAINHQQSSFFGTEFPRFAKRGDMFVRIDILPNRAYKFDGTKWLEINKDQAYLYDDAYIRYLVDQIDNGEYDVDLLSEQEKVQIAEFLRRQQED